MRKDIELAKDQSRTIVGRAREGQNLQDQQNDAASKVQLLQDEVVFNETLATTLKRLLSVRETLDRIKEAILNEDLIEAVVKLDQGDVEIGSLRESQKTRVAGLLGTKLVDLRQDAVSSTEKCWNKIICVDTERPMITLRQQIEGMRCLIPPKLLLIDLKVPIILTSEV